MRILIVTPHFYPETFKCNDMAFELQRRGHDVTVLTAIPDYPQGKFYDGYGVFKKRRETINGVKVYRSLIIPRGDGNKWRLVANYLSYSFFAALKALRLSFGRKFDAILVHETSPVMVGIPAVIVKKIQKIPLHFWILDIWPESLSAAGGISNPRILKPFASLTKWIYKNSDTLLISSNGFRQSIAKLGDFEPKIHYFPNWVDSSHNADDEVDLPLVDETKFNVMFAGNIGEAQDMEHLVKTASLLKDNDIEFLLVGDGRKKKWVEHAIKKNNIKNIKLLGRFPIGAMASVYKRASVLYLSLKKDPLFSLTAPGKLQSYMASGKPIVAMVDGEAAKLVKNAECGWTVPAEDSEALARLLISLSKKDKKDLLEAGRNGSDFSHKHFDFSICMDNLESFLK